MPWTSLQPVTADIYLISLIQNSFHRDVSCLASLTHPAFLFCPFPISILMVAINYVIGGKSPFLRLSSHPRMIFHIENGYDAYKNEIGHVSKSILSGDKGSKN